MTPRETAERHGQDVVDGNLSRIMGDFAGTASTQVMGTGGPPQPDVRALREPRPLLEANGAIIQGTGTHPHVAVQLRERTLSTT